MKIKTKREFKDQLYEQFARIGKVLSNPTGWNLLNYWLQGERTAEELAAEADLPIANAFSTFAGPGPSSPVVDVRVEGLYAGYRSGATNAFRIWQAIARSGEIQLAESTAWFKILSRSALPCNPSSTHGTG